MKCKLCKKKYNTLTTIKSQLGNKWEIELCILCRGDLFLGLQYQITMEQVVDDVNRERNEEDD